MILQNKNIRNRFVILAIVTGMAILAEYLVFILLVESPLFRLKVQGVIGVALIAYLVHTSYKIWFLLNNPFQKNGTSE